MESRVEVRIFASLRRYVDAKGLDVAVVPGGMVRDVVTKLSANYPELGEQILDGDGKLRAGIGIFLNGRNVQLKGGLDTAVQDGDRLAIFPSIGGGCFLSPLYP